MSVTLSKTNMERSNLFWIPWFLQKLQSFYTHFVYSKINLKCTFKFILLCFMNMFSFFSAKNRLGLMYDKWYQCENTALPRLLERDQCMSTQKKKNIHYIVALNIYANARAKTFLSFMAYVEVGVKQKKDI